MKTELEIAHVVVPLGLTIDTVATIWAISRFVPGASKAVLHYVNPDVDLYPCPEALIVNLPPYATRGAIMPAPSPDGGPGSCFRNILDRYCPDESRQVIEPLVLVVENAMKTEAGFDPEAPVDLRGGDMATIFRGVSRIFAGLPERDECTREAMEPVFEALYTLVRVHP